MTRKVRFETHNLLSLYHQHYRKRPPYLGALLLFSNTIRVLSYLVGPIFLDRHTSHHSLSYRGGHNMNWTLYERWIFYRQISIVTWQQILFLRQHIYKHSPSVYFDNLSITKRFNALKKFDCLKFSAHIMSSS